MLLVALYFSLLLLQCNPASSLLSPNAPVLIMVDGLTEYLSGHCKDYCNERGIRIIEILSPYMCGFFQNKGRTVPDKFRPPEEGEELAWAELMNVPISGFEGNNHGIHAISESECGVSTAERLQTSLGLIGNGMSPQLRNKYIMNMRAKAKGIKVLEQALVKSTDELEKFLQKLWSEGDEKLCVLKPYRGVASEGVYLCKSLEEAKKAFKSTYGTKQFGGGDNDAVLVQEYADGPEYAVDTGKNLMLKLICCTLLFIYLSCKRW